MIPIIVNVAGLHRLDALVQHFLKETEMDCDFKIPPKFLLILPFIR